jgi:hypothetical protein
MRTAEPSSFVIVIERTVLIVSSGLLTNFLGNKGVLPFVYLTGACALEHSLLRY